MDNYVRIRKPTIIGEIMTDKVDGWIWIYDHQTCRGSKITLQKFLNKVNHSLRIEDMVYFALKIKRDKYKKENNV